MSARLLVYPGKDHELQDDLESFIHVLVYTALSFTRHNCMDKVGDLLSDMYNEMHLNAEGELVGGTVKDLNFRTRFKTKPVEFEAKSMTNLIEMLEIHVGRWLRATDNIRPKPTDGL
jgi:hypothetical protein